MQFVRRMIASILTAAVIGGAMPGGLALGCITRVPPPAMPCDRGGCEEPDAPVNECICIHYPAPQAPGSLAVIDAAPSLIALAAMPIPALPPPVALPARDDPPDPPPPR